MKIPFISISLLVALFQYTVQAQTEDDTPSTITFEATISYTTKGFIPVEVISNKRWLKNKPVVYTENGNLIIALDLVSYRDGHYEIKDLEVIDPYNQYRLFPELVEGLGTQKDKKTTIKLLNGADNANLKFLVDTVLFSFTIVKHRHTSYSETALGIFNVSVNCLEKPKLRPIWTIVQGATLVAGGYFLGKGISDVRLADDRFQTDYLNPVIPITGVTDRLRQSQDRIRDEIILKDEKGVKKINFGIALLVIDALWSVHRVASHSTKKKFYNSGTCIRERQRLSFQPFIETNNIWTQQMPVGLSLTYTFK